MRCAEYIVRSVRCNFLLLPLLLASTCYLDLAAQ